MLLAGDATTQRCRHQ